MTQLINFFTISSNTDPGLVSAVTAAAGFVAALPRGLYKIAAMDVDLLWKLGPADVTAATGSFLAAGDQEVIVVKEQTLRLSWIRAAAATDDGEINIVPVEIFDVPGQDLRQY